MDGACTLVHTTRKRRISQEILLGKLWKKEPHWRGRSIWCMCGCYSKLNLEIWSVWWWTGSKWLKNILFGGPFEHFSAVPTSVYMRSFCVGWLPTCCPSNVLVRFVSPGFKNDETSINNYSKKGGLALAYGSVLLS